MSPSERVDLADADVGVDRSGPRVRVDAATVAVLHGRHVGDADLQQVITPISAAVSIVPIDRRTLTELTDLDPDVVVIDYVAGEFDVLRLCRDLHDTLSTLVVVVAGRAGVVDEQWHIDLLEAGADDFVAHGASSSMVQARLRVAIRHAPTAKHPVRRMTIGDVVIDLDAHEFFVAGEQVKCPPRQFLLLVALASQPNRVITRDSLLAEVWGAAPGSVDGRRLRIAISLLRAKLGRAPLRPTIETVSHVGYRLALAGSNGD